MTAGDARSMQIKRMDKEASTVPLPVLGRPDAWGTSPCDHLPAVGGEVFYGSPDPSPVGLTAVAVELNPVCKRISTHQTCSQSGLWTCFRGRFTTYRQQQAPLDQSVDHHPQHFSRSPQVAILLSQRLKKKTLWMHIRWEYISQCSPQNYSRSLVTVAT